MAQYHTNDHSIQLLSVTSAEMNLYPGDKLGWAMVIVNGIIMMYSVVIIILSSIVLASVYDLTRVMHESLIMMPNMVLGLGITSLLLMLLGATTWTTRKYWLGITFCVLVSMLLFIEVLLGILLPVAFQFRSVVRDYMEMSIVKYTQDATIAENWDWMQREYSCCGISNYGYNWEWIINSSTGELPMSCCQPITAEIGTSVCRNSSVNVHVDGCLSLGRPVFDNILTGSIMLVVLAGLHFVCVIVGSIFTHRLRSARQSPNITRTMK